MTVKIPIPGVTFTNPEGLISVKRDPIVPAAGALFLADCTHPVNPWGSGVPADSSTIPNLLWEQAAATVGSGSESTLAGGIYNNGLNSTAGLVERSGKGGVHAIISPTTTFSDASVGFNVALAQAIFDYTRVNYTHHYYFSLWHRVTRVQDGAAGTVYLASIAAGTADHLATLTATTSLTGTADGSSSVDGTVGGPRFRNVAGIPAVGFAGTGNIDTPTSPGHRSVFIVGNRNRINNGSAKRGKAGSRIFYRAYLEDLTVSGRTYAQVNAIDVALFGTQCNTPGGRYYGDTFTDPATIA